MRTLTQRVLFFGVTQYFCNVCIIFHHAYLVPSSRPGKMGESGRETRGVDPSGYIPKSELDPNRDVTISVWDQTSELVDLQPEN